ncbi:hypothetical protein ACH4HG_30075 [Streptomyces coeruleorubidus]|uniref:hypothetical protein n=1 Tax=Streptomyces coeruleorubidus TaxID=116188 RepID=UPI0018755246|nr:hypothetical protein [Streptomyces bellus]GGU09019.1 hypothetical protein GCM10010244_39000 [Streptomyces bellus]
MRNVITGDDGPWSWATGDGVEGCGTDTVPHPRTVSRALGDVNGPALDAERRCP